MKKESYDRKSGWTYWHSKSNSKLLLHFALYTSLAIILITYAVMKQALLFYVLGLCVIITYVMEGVPNIRFYLQKNRLFKKIKGHQFEKLSAFYRDIKIASFQYLIILEEYEKRGGADVDALKKIKELPIEKVEVLLNSNNENQNVPIVFGFFDEKENFVPFLSEKIVHFHAEILNCNILIKRGVENSQNDIKKALQDIVIGTMYLEKSFVYLDEKEKIDRASKIKNHGEDVYLDKVKKLKRKTVQDWHKDIHSISHCALFSEDLRKGIQDVELPDPVWITFKSDDKNKIVNHYLLPDEFYRKLVEPLK